MGKKGWTPLRWAVPVGSSAKSFRAVALAASLTGAVAQSGLASEAGKWSCQPSPQTALSWVGKMSLPGQAPVLMTTRYKNGHVRVDTASPGQTSTDAPATSVLFMPNGDHISIIHPQRVYRRNTASERKQMQEAMKGSGMQVPMPTISEVIDGKQEKEIDGRAVHLYIAKLADGVSRMEVWSSANFPQGELIRRVSYCVAEQADPVRSGFGASLVREIPGVGLETRGVFNGQETRSRIQSYSFEPIANEVFSVPAGYKEMAGPFSGAVPPPAAPPPK